MSATIASSQHSIPGAYWQWQDQHIYYVKAGKRQSQRPPLLLIHGFGASTDHWRKNIIGLSDDFEVWAIDLLGFGRSAKPNLPYSGLLWRDQLYDFVTDVIGQPAVLAGNSLGGYAALSLAAQRPSSTAGLVLINSAGPFTEIKPQPQPDPFRRLWGDAILSILRQPWANYLLFQYVRQPWVIRQTLEKVYLDKSAVTDQLVEEIYRPACDRGAMEVFASVFSTRQGEKVDALLRQLTIPLLMLWGEGDPWMNARERGEKFRQCYPQLTEYYLQAGHCPHDEVPDQVNGILAEWISSIANG